MDEDIDMGTIVKLKSELVPATGEPAKHQIVKDGWHLYIDVEYGQRVAAIFYALRQELGGRITVQQEILAKRIAALTTQLEKMEEDFIYRNLSKAKMAEVETAM